MYKFTEDCLTGIEQIDTEHEKLFELINRTMQLLHNDLLQDKYHQVREVMEELKEYADTHFFNEEAYMAAINDPELERQKKQHAGRKLSLHQRLQQVLLFCLRNKHPRP